MKTKISKAITCLLTALLLLSCVTTVSVFAESAPINKYRTNKIIANYTGKKKNTWLNVQYQKTGRIASVTPASFDTYERLGMLACASFWNVSNVNRRDEYGYTCKITADIPSDFAYSWTYKKESGLQVNGVKVMYRDRLYARITPYAKNGKALTSKMFQFKLKSKNRLTTYAAIVFGKGVQAISKDHGSYSLEARPVGVGPDAGVKQMMQVTHYDDKAKIFDSAKVKIEVCVVREFATRSIFGNMDYQLRKADTNKPFKLTYASKGVVLTHKEMWGK